MDTNEKSKNGFSIRDSFFLQSRRDDLRYLRTPPHSFERTGHRNRRIYARVLR